MNKVSVKFAAIVEVEDERFFKILAECDWDVSSFSRFLLIFRRGRWYP